ncbi:collagen alpha-2(I) chain-like [Dromaius novaehollandiae]|uniref:collagen alpha-2(I) chain-like n=1 Tax=Dromaius novaehollandiae TaxID=8790 RepID=UPI0031202306
MDFGCAGGILGAEGGLLGAQGRRVLGAARDGGVAAWDLPPGSPRTRFRDPVAAPACAAVAPPGGPRALLAMTGADGVTRIWEPLEAAAPRSLGGHCGRVTGLGVFAAPPPGGGPAPRAYVITAADDGTVRVVPLPGPDEPLPEQDPGVRGGPGVRGPVAALAWSPDGALAISGGPGGRLVLWGDGQSLAEATCAPPAVTAVAFCDARRVLVAAGRRLELWEVVEEETARGRRHRLRRGGAMAAAAAAMTGGAPASPVLRLLRGGAAPPARAPGFGRRRQVTAAGGPRPDAWAPLPDAWAPPADANRPDAGAPEDSRAPEDAWAPRPDAGAPRPDAGAPEDAWAPSPDAGAPEDAWAPAAFRLPGSPVDAQALPDGSVLVWAGATRPHLCRLVPAGEGWRVQDAWALAAPLEPHGPSQWFNGACYIPGAGVFLARSDGTLCVSPGWGDAGAPGAAWRCRKLAHFACAGPVSCLEPRPGPRPGLALGDAWGRVYFLRWDTPP